jgi:hypothetical protein
MGGKVFSRQYRIRWKSTGISSYVAPFPIVGSPPNSPVLTHRVISVYPLNKELRWLIIKVSLL